MSYPEGIVSYEVSGINSGQQLVVFDHAWPNGIREELSPPMALLLNEGADVLAVEKAAGFRYFTAGVSFRRYVSGEILVEVETIA